MSHYRFCPVHKAISHRWNAVTLAEGASVYSVSAAQTTTIAGMAVSDGTEVKCKGTGNGGEVDCVQAIAISADGIATTLVTSYVATTSPIFTITGTVCCPYCHHERCVSYYGFLDLDVDFRAHGFRICYLPQYLIGCTPVIPLFKLSSADISE